MKSLLKDLFMGRIDVMGSMPFKGKNNVASEVLFIKTLTSEQKELYDNLMDQCALEYGYCFITGFKMGVQLLLECLSDTMENEDSSDSL